jgi:hypothetical protein
MKKLFKLSFILFMLFPFLSGNLNAQNEFKDKIVPLLDSIGQPYKLAADKTYMVTYCENNDCIPVFVFLNGFNDNKYSWFIQCFTFLYSDNGNPTPSKSLIQKVYDLNSTCDFGKFAIKVYESSYAVYYMNEVWFDDLNYQNILKNIQVNYNVGISNKKDFDVFKE